MIALFGKRIARAKNRKYSRQSGMTLIEIVLVLALLGLVITFIGKKVFSTFNKGKRKLTAVYLSNLKGELDQYKVDCNTYPKSLQALVVNPGDCPAYDPEGYEGGKKTLQKDPWGCEPVYSYDGDKIELKSLGEGCKEGGEGNSADMPYEE